jgi:SPP1 family predicted phage head-tail adaptor
MPYVRAGELRSRVDIVAPAGTQTATGGLLEAPTTIASRVPAAVTATPAGELLQAGALQAGIGVLVRIRYQAGILPYMRLVLDGRDLQILAIVDIDNRHVTLELSCTEIQ